MRLSEATRPDPSEATNVVGRIKAAPDTETEGVYVIVDDFDQRFEWGPYPWRPRGDDWPARDDRALVTRVGSERFLVDWWPR